MKPGLFRAILLFFTTSVLAHHGNNFTHQDIDLDQANSWLDWLVPQLAAKATERIDTANGHRYIVSDGLANHTTGRFPNSGNPHAIKSQNYTFRMPLNPVRRNSPQAIGHNSFGVALNGVPFDPATAEYWNNDRSADWNIEAIGGGLNLGLDQNNAHVQPTGAYHYHGIPTGLLDQSLFKTKPVLLGYAADGFPVYSPWSYASANDASSEMRQLKSSWRIKSGNRTGGPGGSYDGTYTRDYEYVEGLGDLDQCNGREGVTPEYPDGTYYYVITAEFPQVPRCWFGSYDSSFRKNQGGGNRQGNNQRQGRPSEPASAITGQQRGAGRQPPPEAVSACQGKSEGSRCSFRAPHGNLSGICRTIHSNLACAPARR